MKRHDPLSRGTGRFPIGAIGTGILFLVLCLAGFFLCSRKEAGEEKPVQVVKEALRSRERAAQRPVPLQGYMAIVLDDWGYNRTHCKYLESISAPLGIAILPDLPYSADVVACARANGKEPMLHLPMEAHKPDPRYPEQYFLTTDMSVADMRRFLLQHFQQMPGVVGVNNHMGSKATESPEVMQEVLQEVKRRKLFFVDSFTSERSVGTDAARDLKMKIARRDVFLDNSNERVAIERQFASGVRLAKKNGFALLIGHDRDLTLKIVKEQTDKLRQEGIEFLSVKEYIRRYEHSRN